MARGTATKRAPLKIGRGDAARGADPSAGSATGELNLLWAQRFVTALAEGGVYDACICSGSRSAPLALALSRRMRTHVPLDERAGAYFALGLAKASRRPVAILTTSGTAAANLYPAAVEAYHARVPLILLTADRPPELRDTGAGQAIDQIKMFGTVARWFHEVGIPLDDPDLLRYVGSLGIRAAAEASGPPAGPVHLNFPFREPLLPEPDPLEEIRMDETPPEERWQGLEIIGPPSTLMTARAARGLRGRARGLILCGPNDGAPEFPAAAAGLAAATGYPILADPASQVRYGPHDRSRVLGSYDAFLRSPAFAARETPEVVIQFGAALTSKAYHLYVARHRNALHLIVDPGGGWRSPSRQAVDLFRADPTDFALALTALVQGSGRDEGWGETFARADRAALAALERNRHARPGLSEGTLFPELLEAVPERTILYVGNSMAIRDLDLFAPGSQKRVRVLANRGANGIDGVVSSGLGASAAGEAPVLIVTGDLSFHHDLNALSALRDGKSRATIVIVMNDGGGIFSFLPVARYGRFFERYFGTPHGLDFSSAAALYGVPFTRPGSWRELRDGVARSLGRRETEVFEVRSSRDENRVLHQALWADVIAAVEDET